jgi:hypothetical protein
MNSKQYVRKLMRVEKEGDKWRLKINIDFNFATDCPLNVNGAACNSGKPGFREPKFFGSGRLIHQIVELFYEDIEKELERRRHSPSAVIRPGHDPNASQASCDRIA